MAFPGDYTRIAEYELPSITGSHTDFPLYLKYADFTSGALASIDDGGGDLRFSSDAAGTNQLPCHVVEFDKVGNDVEVRIKIPTGATSEVIHIWGDNTGDSQPAVTDTFGRNAVYSLFTNAFNLRDTADTDNIAGGTDSITATGTLANSSESPPYSSQSVDFSNSLFYTNDGTLSGLGSFHVSGWAYVGGTTPTVAGVFSQFSSNTNMAVLLWYTGGGELRCRFRSGGTTHADLNLTEFALNSWSRYDVVYDGSTLEVFINGVSDASQSATGSTSSTADYNIATWDSNTSREWEAEQNTFFVQEGATRSSDFILTEYQNQSAVGAWGTMTDVAPGGIVIPVIINSYKQRRV